MTVDFWIQLGATVGLLYGLWKTGDIRLRGPILAMLAEICTTAVGLMHNAWSIVVIGVVLFFVQARNAYKWHVAGIPW